MIEQRDSLTTLKSFTFHTSSLTSLSTDRLTKSSSSSRTLSDRSGGNMRSRYSDEYSRLTEDSRRLDEAIRSITLLTLEGQGQGHKIVPYNSAGEGTAGSCNDTEFTLPGSVTTSVEEPSETRSQPLLDTTDRTRAKKSTTLHTGDIAYGKFETNEPAPTKPYSPSTSRHNRTSRKVHSVPLLPEGETVSVPSGPSSTLAHHIMGKTYTDKDLSSQCEDDDVLNMWHQPRQI